MNDDFGLQSPNHGQLHHSTRQTRSTHVIQSVSSDGLCAQRPSDKQDTDAFWTRVASMLDPYKMVASAGILSCEAECRQL